jgi:hypothetical protein
MPNSAPASKPSLPPKMPRDPWALQIFVPYRPPSRNRSDGHLRRHMQDKAAARAAWSSASSDYAAGLSTMTTLMARANTSGMPLPPASALTTATNASAGNINNSKPAGVKAS